MDDDLHGTDVESLVLMNLDPEPVGEPETDHPDNGETPAPEADLSGDAFEED
jgi:hypothetical protein